MMHENMHPRSALFTPADDIEMLEKALRTQADRFIFDLEDAVHPSQRELARKNLRRFIPEQDENREIAVRVNPRTSSDFSADLTTAVDAGVDAVLLPMVECAEDVREAWTALSTLSREPPILRVLIETPTGMHSGPDIVTTFLDTGVVSLGFGFADYCKAIQSPGTPDFVRQRLELLTVELAAIGGVEAVSSVHLDIGDKSGLREVANRARSIGFSGMTAIHPDQIEVINEAFTPSEQEIDQAKRLVEAFDATDRDSIEIEGIFLDTATVDRYRILLQHLK
jgi:citrate lyase subunit beta/citryl-CoA lyase